MKSYEFIKPKQLTESLHDTNIFKAIIMAGPPGSGKDYIIKQLALEHAGFKISDIDNTLYYLKKLENDLDGLLEPTDPDYEHSFAASMEKQQIWKDSHLGLLINTTARDHTRIKSLADELRNSGYDVFMICVDVDREVALRRIEFRKTQSLNKWERRGVKIPYFHQAYDSLLSHQSSGVYRTMFGRQYAEITNNVETFETRYPQLKNDPDFAEEKQSYYQSDEYLDDVDNFKAELEPVVQKVNKFLNKPLTNKAQTIVAELQSQIQQGQQVKSRDWSPKNVRVRPSQQRSTLHLPRTEI